MRRPPRRLSPAVEPLGDRSLPSAQFFASAAMYEPYHAAQAAETQAAQEPARRAFLDSSAAAYEVEANAYYDRAERFGTPARDAADPAVHVDLMLHELYRAFRQAVSERLGNLPGGD